jgi:glycosyltransferase involved in cell wall biosynthesis
MFFSVLVPVYNAGNYLETCVQSALRQTERDFELVLVDDGSTDGSGEVCDRFAAQNLGLVRVVHQPNRGLILTRRVGIALAQGEYCVFLDADDWLEDNALAVIRETIERTDADIVIYDNYDYFDKERTTTRVRAAFADNAVFVGETKRTVYEMLFASWRLNNIWMKAIRTSLLRADDTPYPDFADNPHAEDLLQTLYPVTHAEKIVYRALPLYYYRRRSGSICTNISVDDIRLEHDERVTRQQLRYMADWGMDTPANRKRLYARKLTALLTEFWQYYRRAKGGDEKRTVLEAGWPAYLAPYCRDGGADALSPVKRLQLRAIQKKRKCLLDMLNVLGRLQRKVKYGA